MKKILFETFLTYLKINFADRKVLIIALLIFAALVLPFSYFYKPASLNIEFQAEIDSAFQVYWAKANENYSEEKSTSVYFDTTERQCNLSLPDLQRIVKLRIDPVQMKPSKILINKIVINQLGYEVIRLKTPDELKRVKPIYEIEKYAVHQNGLMVVPSGNDPQLELYIRPIIVNQMLSYLNYLIGIFISALIAYILAFYVHNWLKNRQKDSLKYAPISIISKKKKLRASGIFSVIGSIFLMVVIPVELPESLKLLFLTLYLSGISILLFLICYWLLSRPIYKYPSKKVISPHSWLLYAMPCYFIWTMYLLAFWPGSMSPDSLSQWQNAMTGRFHDWHPAFHSMNIWVIIRIWQSPAAVAFTQIFFLGLAAGWGMVTLRRFGVSAPAIWASVFLFALSPLTGFMVITLWKDVAYTICVLVITLCVIQIIISNGEWINKRGAWFLFGLIIALTALYRHNGVLAAFGTPLVLIFFYRPIWKKLTFALLFGIAIYGCIRGPFYSFLDVNRSSRPRPFKLRLAQSVEDTNTFSKETSLGLFKKKVKSNIKKAVKILKDYSELSSTLWRIKPLQGRFIRTDNCNVWWQPPTGIRYINSNRLGINQAPVLPKVRDFLFDRYVKSTNIPFSYFIWRPAFYIYLFLASLIIVSIRIRSWKYLLIAVPVLIHSLPFMILQTQKVVLRYHYPVFVVSLLLSIPFYFFSSTNEKMPKS